MVFRMVCRIVFLLFFSIYSSIALAENSLAYQKETDHLKAYITDSSCVFMRNGNKYKGSEAIGHINRKEKYFKNKITSTEDFIRLAATKSEISGKKYKVICIDNTAVNLGEWLQIELVYFRNNH